MENKKAAMGGLLRSCVGLYIFLSRSSSSWSLG